MRIEPSPELEILLNECDGDISYNRGDIVAASLSETNNVCTVRLAGAMDIPVVVTRDWIDSELVITVSLQMQT